MKRLALYKEATYKEQELELFDCKIGPKHCKTEHLTIHHTLVNIWVVYLGQEADLQWGHWIVFGKEEFQLENTT